MSREEVWFNRCEKTYPKLSYGRCCAVCASKWKVVPATEIHHVIPRVFHLLRFHPLNLVPLCHHCHEEITNKRLDEPITTKHREWLEKMAQKDFKGYLIAKGITREEYYEWCYKQLKQLILY